MKHLISLQQNDTLFQWMFHVTFEKTIKYNHMKKLFILLLLCTSVTFAQKDSFKKSLSGIKKVHIECDTDVTVVAGNTSELIISEGRMVKDDNDKSVANTLNNIGMTYQNLK